MSPGSGVAPPGRRTAVALVADLLFTSRIRGAASLAGVEVVAVGSAEQLLEVVLREQPALVLVDLDARAGMGPRAIARLKAEAQTRHIPVVAFGAHVQAEALQAARAAGAERVLARSAFVRELPRLLGGDGGHAADAPP